MDFKFLFSVTTTRSGPVIEKTLFTTEFEIAAGFDRHRHAPPEAEITAAALRPAPALPDQVSVHFPARLLCLADMSSPAQQSVSQFYRASVGAVIVNADGETLAFERSGIAGAWQLPQGGLEAGEEPLDAVIREIFEETGIDARDLALLAEHPRLLSYELPAEMRSNKTGRGQTQRWFLFRFVGDPDDIRLPADSEFSAWRWMPLKQLAETTVFFRQDVYRELATGFSAVE